MNDNELKNRIDEWRADLNVLGISSGITARKELYATVIGLLGDEDGVTGRVKRIFLKLLDGCTCHEIASIEGITGERVRQIMSEAFRDIDNLTKYRDLVEENKRMRKDIDILQESLERYEDMLAKVEEVEDTYELLIIPIEELHLSARSYNILYFSKMRTVGDIVRKSDKELKQLRNFGETCQKEVTEKITNLGLHFSYNVDAVIAKHFRKPKPDTNL